MTSRIPPKQPPATSSSGSRTSSAESRGRRSPSRERFFGARVDIEARCEEDAVAAFWDVGCLGIEVVSSARDRKAPRITLRAYFPGRWNKRALSLRVARSLRRAGIAPARPVRLQAFAERRWVEAWRRSLRPMAIGRRFLVVPEGRDPQRRSGRLTIRIRFGQAFGTGEHASTRMCLRLLEGTLRPESRVADLGTGTGILAIAARLLGARRVLAADIDPVALRVAADNLALNGLRGAVTLLRAEASEACRRGPFDVALVNIGASVIGRILPDLARALAPGGRAVLAGLLIEDEDAILRGAASLGFRLERRLRARPWSALLLAAG